MSRHPLIKQRDYLTTASVFHWATKEHYTAWFTGSFERHKRTEVVLPRLVKRGKLKSVTIGNRILYCIPRKCKGRTLYIEHGLGCTEGLVRIWRSDMNSMIIPERFFQGFGNVPEWGIKYQNGKLLLYEFCTKGNFEKPGLVKGKINRYRDSLLAIGGKFEGEGIVLLVADVPRQAVKNYVEKSIPEGPFLFTDYQTFKSIPIGENLKAPIYIWGENGQEYPLRND